MSLARQQRSQRLHALKPMRSRMNCTIEGSASQLCTKPVELELTGSVVGGRYLPRPERLLGNHVATSHVCSRFLPSA
jgi:hypothetical protein